MPFWNPLKCNGTDLPTNLTVMVKVLALVLLITNHVRILPDPWLPFIPAIDLIPAALFQRTLRTVFVISALAIVFNRRIRLSSLILGSTMLLAVVSSKAYYGNNKTFCGLMLFLAGLHKTGGPNFIRWQLAITYLGAGLNKLVDADWHSGVFFQNWAVNRLQQPWYIALDSRLPSMLLARFICWTTIVTELGIVPCLFISRLNALAIAANVLFQASLLLFTGATFTLFFYSMTAASLGLVTWPASPVSVFYDPTSALAKFFAAWDLDRRFLWTKSQSALGLHVVVGDTVYRGFRAFQMILLLNPITYFAIASAIAVGDLTGSAALYRRLIVAASLLLLMPPVSLVSHLETKRDSS